MKTKSERKSLLSGWRLLAILGVLIVFIFLSINSNNKDNSDIDNIPTATWHFINTFSGTGDSEYTFKIQGNQFRLTYNAKPYYSLDLDPYTPYRVYSLLTLYYFVQGSTKKFEYTPRNIWKEEIHNKDGTVKITMGNSNKTFVLTSAEYLTYKDKVGMTTPQVEELLRLEEERIFINGVDNDILKKIEGNEIFQEITARGLFWKIKEEKLNNYTGFDYLISGTGTTISYGGAGEYKLLIGTTNIGSWSVSIEDYY